MGRTLLLSLAVIFLAAPLRAERFDVVVEQQGPETAALVKALRSAGGAGEEGALFDLSAVDFSNPIAKGKLLARLARADLLVPVGEGATRFVAREFDETPAFFVGAAVVEGQYLASPNVAGILAIDPESILRAAKALGLRRVGVAYTPGYAPVADRLGAMAANAGVTLHKAQVDSPAAVVPVVQKLFGGVDAVWVLGDPVLARGAGFEFLVEQSLARNVPFISPSTWGVARGALFCFNVDSNSLAASAAADLKRMLDTGLRPPTPRLETASSGGSVIYNSSLMKRWGFAPPKGGQWQPSR